MKAKARKSVISNDEGPTTKIARTNKMKINLEIPKRLKAIGNLLSCGQNEVGQLGLGEDVQEKTRPALIGDAKQVVDISAGGMHSLYLDGNGDVYSFGCNDEGALGRPTTEEGSEYEVLKIDLPGKCVKLSTGDSHSACLLEDGRVFAWGSFRDSHGNMGLTLEGNKKLPIEVVPTKIFVDISSGADHLVLLTDTGKVYTIGCGEQGQLGRVTARSSSGESRRGKTELLQPGIVQFNMGRIIDAIWATTYCTFVRVQPSGDIYGFGLNNYYQLCVDKKVDLLFVPKKTNFTNVKSIQGGQHHTLVLTNDNKCFVIGRKDYGRLGIGAVTEDLDILTKITILDDKNIIKISCGESCSFALTKDGKVYGWGMGSNNQLGTGSDEDAYEPVLLTGQQVKNKEVLNVNGGGQHTLFLVKPSDTTTTAAAATSTTTESSNTTAKTNGN